MDQRTSLKPLTIATYQQMVDGWVENSGVRYFNAQTMMAQVTEEMGKLAQVVAEKPADADAMKALADAMADVMCALTNMANRHDVDLTAALQHNINLKIREGRDYQPQSAKMCA